MKELSLPPLPPRARQKYILEKAADDPPPLPPKQSKSTSSVNFSKSCESISCAINKTKTHSRLFSIQNIKNESRMHAMFSAMDIKNNRDEEPNLESISPVAKVVASKVPKMTPYRLDVYKSPPFLYESELHTSHLPSQAIYPIHSVIILPSSKDLLIGTTGLRLLSLRSSAKQVSGLKDMVTSKVICLAIVSQDHVWAGTSCGSLFIYHIPSSTIISRRAGIHSCGLGTDSITNDKITRGEVIHIIFNSFIQAIWTIDLYGRIFAWDLKYRIDTLEHSHTITFKLVTSNKSFHISKILQDRVGLFHQGPLLLIISKKCFAYCDPTKTEYSIQNGGPQARLECNLVDITSLLSSSRVGCITCTDKCESFLVTGHETGKIAVWDISTFHPLQFVQISMYKITSIKISSIMNGEIKMWVGLSTGKIVVLYRSLDKWSVFAEWKLHRASVDHLVSDHSGNVMVSACQNSQAMFWDATLTNITESKKKKQQKSSMTVSLHLTSWNVGAIRPSVSKPFIIELLKEATKFDMFVIGLQEIVDLESKRDTARALLSKDKSGSNAITDESVQSKSWTNLIQECLDIVYNNFKFVLLGNVSMVGLMMTIWMRKELSIVLNPRLDWGIVKTGLGGIHGNKGAVYTRCILNNTTSMALFNVHLAAGQDSVSQRNSDASVILRSASFPLMTNPSVVFEGGGDGSTALDCSYIFFFGDLNYRIQLGRRQVMQYIQQGDLLSLWKHDQLEQQRHTNPHFVLSCDGFLEAFMNSPKSAYEEEFKSEETDRILPSCNFLPTYKYDIGKDDYDTSEKQRIPSWCDRILIRCQPSRRELSRGIDEFSEGIRLIAPIHRWECKVSDHRPISSTFLIPIRNAPIQ